MPFHSIDDLSRLSDVAATIGLICPRVFTLIQAVLPLLHKSPQASLVFYSTVAVSTGMPFHASVAAAKGALEGLTRSLAAEYAPKFILTCIAPSLTDTPFSHMFLLFVSQLATSQARHPLKHVGSAQTIAQIPAFLLG